MNSGPSVDRVIEQYLDAVARHVGPEQRDAVLLELREHIDEAIRARASGRAATLQDAYATLAEMDPPETYSDASASGRDEPGPNRRLTVLGLICSGLQIIGLGLAVAGVPVLGAIAGFAAVVSFFVIWSNRRSPRWLIRLTGVAALCGVGTIVIEIARVF